MSLLRPVEVGDPDGGPVTRHRLGDHTGGAAIAHDVDDHLIVLKYPVPVGLATDAHRGLIGADNPRAAQPGEDRCDLVVETGLGTLQHRIQRALADRERIEVHEQLRQTAVADRLGEAQIDRQSGVSSRHASVPKRLECDDIDAERRAFLHANGHRRQGDAAAAGAVPGVAFHPRHHRTHDGQVDLVVAPVQHLVGICQRGLAVRTGWRLRGHRLVGIAGQRAATALATQAAFARSDALGFLRVVRLLTLRRRQAGIVRGLRRFVELSFEPRDPRRPALNLRPQLPDQGVFLGVAQVVEVGKLGHAPG